MKRRPSSAKWQTPKKQDWRIKKDLDAPDMATYDAHTSKDFVLKRSMAVSMSKSLILRFSDQVAKDKMKIPSADKYNPGKCYSHIARVGMKKRV